MSSVAALLAESDAALGTLAGVDDAHAPAAARHAARRLAALALRLEEQAETGACLLLDELAALCRGAAGADRARRGPMVAAVREGFATLFATGAATRAAVESVAEVNRLRALRGTAPVRLAPLLAATPPAAAALLPSQLARRARQWRATFQLGLTAWLRGQDEATEPLRTVLARVSDIASESPSRAFWQAAALFTDALPPTPHRASAEDRRRLVRIDAALRRVADEGATAFADEALEATDDLLSALVTLRPQALPPRGVARAALLRFLQAELATLRADFAAAERAPRTAPVAARQVADTLGLLELCAPRRRLLATCEHLRARAGDEARLAELSALMFELEGAARQSSGEPALAPPPSFARELNALADVLAEPLGVTTTVDPATPPTPRRDDAELLAAVTALETPRASIESGIAAARERLLDIEESAAALREALVHVELGIASGDAADSITEARSQLGALDARSNALETVLRELQAPLAAQARAQEQLRRRLDTTTLSNLAAPLHAHARRAAAASGAELTLDIIDDGEALFLPGAAANALLTAMLDHLLEGDGGERLVVELGCAREGAWLQPWLRCIGSTRDREHATGSSWEAARDAARRLGGTLHTLLDDDVLHLWARLPDPHALRSLLRVEIGGRAWAVPVADVQAVRRNESAHADVARSSIDLGALLGVARSRDAGAALRIEVEGEAVDVLVDDVEELGSGTPLPLSEPLSSLGWLAGVTRVGDDRVLAVLDLGEIVLSQRTGTAGADA